MSFFGLSLPSAYRGRLSVLGLFLGSGVLIILLVLTIEGGQQPRNVGSC